MRKSKYSLSAPDIEEKLQEMMNYTYSEEGKHLNKSVAYLIAGLILEGKSFSETSRYLGISGNTLLKYIDPSYRKKTRKDNNKYKQEKRRCDPEFKENERNYQRNRRKTDFKLRENARNYQRNRRKTDPELRQKKSSYAKGCLLACLYEENDVYDNFPLSKFLTHKELNRRKKELGLEGNLTLAIREWTRRSITVEVNDLGTKRYALDFSSLFFDDLERMAE